MVQGHPVNLLCLRLEICSPQPCWKRHLSDSVCARHFAMHEKQLESCMSQLASFTGIGCGMVPKAMGGTTHFRRTCPPKPRIGSCWDCVLAGSLSQRRREMKEIKEMLSAFCDCHGQVTLAGVSQCRQTFPHSSSTANIMKEACCVATLCGSKDGLFPKP